MRTLFAFFPVRKSNATTFSLEFSTKTEYVFSAQFRYRDYLLRRSFFEWYRYMISSGGKTSARSKRA